MRMLYELLLLLYEIKEMQTLTFFYYFKYRVLPYKNISLAIFSFVHTFAENF